MRIHSIRATETKAAQLVISAKGEREEERWRESKIIIIKEKSMWGKNVNLAGQSREPKIFLRSMFTSIYVPIR